MPEGEQPTPAGLRGHRFMISGLTFSRDGRRLASASWDRTIKLWDVTSAEEALTLPGHTSWVFSVAFSPDGQRLASASGDKTIRIWDATPVGKQEALHEVRTLRDFTTNSDNLAAGLRSLHVQGTGAVALEAVMQSFTMLGKRKSDRRRILLGPAWQLPTEHRNHTALSGRSILQALRSIRPRRAARTSRHAGWNGSTADWSRHSGAR